MAILKYYRKDQLTPIEVDDRNTDFIAQLERDGYTQDEQKAISESGEVGGTNYTGTAADTTTSSTTTSSGYTAEQAQVLMPWLTKLAPVEGRKLIDEYVQGYIETGEATFALAR